MKLLKVSRNLILLLLLIVVVALLVLAAGQLGSQNANSPGVVTANVRATPLAGVITPPAPYGPIDPAIIPALQSTPGSQPFAVLPGVQPIGEYLPGIQPRGQLPTLTPSATATPLPPTFTPTPEPPTPTPTFHLPSFTPRVPTSELPTIPPTPTITPRPISPTPPPLIGPTSPPTPTKGPTRTRPPLPTGFPTPTNPPEGPVEDLGIIQLQGLRMTPNPQLIGNNCAPKGLPVDGVLTQRFHRYHTGIDLGVSVGTPVLATHSGQVIFAGWSNIGYGWLVIVQNGHYITYYAHNNYLNVVPFQYVLQGQNIAFSGSTGNSSGPHVHYETRIDDYPVDALTFDSRGLPSC